MAKQRKDWKLGELNFVSTKEQKVAIEKPKHAETVVTLISHVNDESALLSHINSIEGRDGSAEDKKPLTVADVLADYINSNIMTNTKIQLRLTADPSIVVNRAIAKVKKMFPNLPEEQVAAMAEMLKNSVEN